MKLEHSFESRAPWIGSGPCSSTSSGSPVPSGAAITERDDEGAYHGTFRSSSARRPRPTAARSSIDRRRRGGAPATLKAQGSDKRGQGGANATIVNKLLETDDGTRVEAVTDFTITGRLARFGRGGMIEDISNRMMGDFAQCLRKSLEAQDGPGSDAPGAEQSPPPRAEPIRGGSLFFSVLWARIKRLFGGGRKS